MKDSIFRITKKEKGGYGKTREFEIYNSNNTWHCVELITLPNHEIHSKFIGKAEEFEGVQYLLR